MHFNNPIHLPTILAIDTATDACSVAVYYQNILIERHEVEARAHTRLLLPLIDALLKELGIHLSELDALAWGKGPGSFTGVRIAAAFVQALCLSLQKPVISISSLRVLAQSAEDDQPVCALFEANLQQVYWGLFERDSQGLMRAMGGEHLSSREQIILPNTQSWSFQEGYPHAKHLALLARNEFEKGHFTAPECIVPSYIKHSSLY